MAAATWTVTGRATGLGDLGTGVRSRLAAVEDESTLRMIELVHTAVGIMVGTPTVFSALDKIDAGT